MAEGLGPRVMVRGLVAGYGRPGRTPDVLRGLDLEIRPGVVTAIVGPNGAGKSTLFRTLLGLMAPRSGRVTIGGRGPRAHRSIGGFGYLPESVVLPRGWTVRTWVRSAVRLKGGGGASDDEAADALLDAMGVAGQASARLERVSRGTARRVALAWVLAGPPPVVLLDEPLAALDAPARVLVREAVDRLRRAGSTVLVATHELHEVPALAGRAIVLAAGRVIATLKPPDPCEMEARIMEAGGSR